MTTHLSIPGVPVPQPRQRVAILAGHATTYTPTRHPVNAFKAAAKLAWRDQCPTVAPAVGPVRLTAFFILPKPASRTRSKDAGKRQYISVKPDLDNLAKSLLDALTGLAWLDDAQVADLVISKCYVVTDEKRVPIEQPRVDVIVTELETKGGTT
jgi:Holliday junction resolvase RusA-like endonuclease